MFPLSQTLTLGSSPWCVVVTRRRARAGRGGPVLPPTTPLSLTRTAAASLTVVMESTPSYSTVSGTLT